MLIAVLSPKVDYAQLITITAVGKSVTGKKLEQKQSQVQNLTLIDNLAHREVDTISGKELNLALPLDNLTVTSSFGERFHPIYHREKLHAGVDLKAFYEPVYAFAGGVVTQAGYDTKSGNYITILHGTSGTLSSVYAHLSYLQVKAGDKIPSGYIIGISGNTGSSTAPHLHFALKVRSRPIDPVPVLKSLVHLLEVTGQGDDTEKGAENVKGK